MSHSRRQRIPGSAVLVTAALLAVSLAGWGQLQIQNQEIASLTERNQMLERELLQNKAEKARLSELAEKRSQELWNELERRRLELFHLSAQLGRPVRRALPRLASRAGLHGRYRALEREIRAAGVEVQRLSLAARAEKASRLRHTPRGAPCQGEMTSPFGHRTHPVYGTGRQHNGCDFTTEEGTKIFATADGTVVTSDWLGGYGQVIEIDHGYGLKTLYAHCSRLQAHKGQSIRRGDWIACVGMTGLASGPHCHYEVHLQGKPVDPQSYLPSNLKTGLPLQRPLPAADPGGWMATLPFLFPDCWLEGNIGPL